VVVVAIRRDGYVAVGTGCLSDVDAAEARLDTLPADQSAHPGCEDSLAA
jgi:hypothetical protein